MNETAKNIAKIFKVVGYILLIPGTLLALLPVGLMVEALTDGRFEQALISLGSIALYLAGVILLIGYHKHSNRNLQVKKVFALWIGTIIFNLLLVAPPMWMISQVPLKEGLEDLNLAAVIYVFIMVWQLIAVALATKALREHLSPNQKYR